MRIKRMAAVALATLVFGGVVALPAAAAVFLPVQTASNKAIIFAQRSCNHDPHCVKFGVTNCRRQSLHVVLCRIAAERQTAVQGRYACTKLVRVALDPVDYRVVVTGTGAWSCH